MKGPDVMALARTLLTLGFSVPSVLGCDGEAMFPEVVSRISISIKKEWLLTVRKGQQKLSALCGMEASTGVWAVRQGCREREPNHIQMVTVSPSSSSKSHAPEDYLVMLGSTQLYQHTQHTRKMYVSRIITHPDFEKFHAFGNDIAMLQLHLPVNFTSYISPACLPTPGVQLPIYQSCWITGWGMLSEDSEGVWEVGVHESREVEEGEQKGGEGGGDGKREE